MYIKKPEFIVGADQVCSPHTSVLPLAGTHTWCFGRKAFLS